MPDREIVYGTCYKTVLPDDLKTGSTISCLTQLVPKVGLEPTHPLRRGILNPLRLPFRHLGNDLNLIAAL